MTTRSGVRPPSALQKGETVNHEFSELQEMLGQTARELFTRDYPMDRMRDIRRSDLGYDPDLWSSMVELGWNAAPFPEAMGGTGGGFMDVTLLLEEMGKACAASPFLHSTVASGLAILDADADLAAAIAEGSAVVIPALTASVQESGSGDAVTLTGEAVSVPWAALATHFLVPLDDDDRMAVVEAGAAGVSSEQLPAAGGDPLFVVNFDGTPGRVISSPGLRTNVQALGAAAAAIVMLGLCQRTLELSADYSKDRIAFGKPIGAFQAISHKCANMVIDIEVGRYLAYKAAWLHSEGRPFVQTAHYAKAFLGDATGRVTRDGIQVHGGVGFIDDHFVQFPYRLGISMASQYGTAHEHRAAVADAVLGPRS